MSETFSPYRDWLGLTGVTSRPDHYQLLGLAPLEADPAAIRAAADRSLTRLRGISPAGQDRDWMQLMRELLEAEETLTDPNRKAEYDRRLRGPAEMPAGFAPQPGYGQAPPQYAAYPPPAGPWQQGPNPMAPVGGYGAPMPPQYAAPPAPWNGYPPPAYPQQQAYPNYYAPQPGFAPPPPPPPPMSNVPDPMAPIGFDAPHSESPFGLPAAPEFAPRIGPKVGAKFAPPAEAIAYATAAPMGTAVSPEPPAEPELAADRRWKRDEEEQAATATKAVLPKPVKQVSLDDEAELSERNLQKMLIPLVGVAAAALLVMIVVNSMAARPKQVAKNPDPTHTTTPVANPTPKPDSPPKVETPSKVDPPAEESVEPPTKPEPKPPRRKPKPEPEAPPAEEMPADPVKKPVEEPKPEPIKPTTPLPEPTPESTKPESSGDMPKPEDVIKLAKALQEARVLVRESNTTEALKLLKEVESLPMAPAHRAKWDRLYFLTDSVAQCIAALKRTVPRLEAASTITVGSTVVSIVEGSEESITVRINGQNRRYNLTELPVGLGIALADMSLDRKEPVNLVVKGAYVVARSSDDAQIAKARAWWQEAIASGVSECERLVPVIEDKYDLEKDLPRN